MRVKQVMQRLSVSDETVYKLCNTGLLEHFRVGRMIRVSEAQLQAYLNRSERQPSKYAPAYQRTQRLSPKPEPNWDAPICHPRVRKKKDV